MVYHVPRYRKAQSRTQTRGKGTSVSQDATVPPEVRMQLQSIGAEVMAVDEVDEVSQGPRGAVRLRGQLLVEAQQAYDTVAPRFRALGFTALLRRDGARDALLAVQGTVAASPPNLGLALLFFALTVVSTFVTGAFSFDEATCSQVFSIGKGLAFSAAIMGILGAHELGHYFVARRLGVATSFPYFIPLPLLSPFGTMGAFIAMKEPPVNRRALMSIAIAGPLAGMAVAIPVLIIGLLLSPVQAIGSNCVPAPQFFMVKYAVFGRWLPDGTQDVLLHPVALAGWAGLLVTGLNLIPAGQLDGGHLLYALFGPRVAEWTTIAMAACLVALGFLWSGWFLWAILIALFGRQRAAPLNEISELDRPRRLLALAGLILFVLVFTPQPLVVL
jgi:membrane-associated protease RseP (regulator of RpoE activity)